MVYPDEHEEAEEAGDGQRQIADDVAKLDEAALPQLASIFRETRVLGVCRYAKVPVLQGIMGLL